MKISAFNAIAAILLFMHRPTYAISFSDAGENLLYFEYASLSADYCEQRGYPSRSIYSKWQQTYSQVQIEAVKRVLAEGQSRGLTTGEQRQVLSQALASHRKVASDNIAKKGVPCSRYREFLVGYSGLLKK
jgi:hypothetical protein